MKVQPYMQLTLSISHFTKLSTKYYGLYQILERVGTVAYKLALPSQLLLHPTFHVSLLKPCYEVPTKVNHPPILDLSSLYCPCPTKILDRRMIQKGNKVVVQFLIQWEQLPVDQATWEDSNAIKVRFPTFIP